MILSVLLTRFICPICEAKLFDCGDRLICSNFDCDYKKKKEEVKDEN